MTPPAPMMPIAVHIDDAVQSFVDYNGWRVPTRYQPRSPTLPTPHPPHTNLQPTPTTHPPHSRTLPQIYTPNSQPIPFESHHRWKHPLIEQYNYELETRSIHTSTFYRFMCRLSESIGLYKNRAGQKAGSPLLDQFLAKVEQSVLSYSVDRNIGRIFKRITQLAFKTCQLCEPSTTPQCQPHPSFFKCQQQQKNSEHKGTSKSKFHSSSSESHFHKAMNVLNKRFSSLGCLDIDYGSFKMSFFQAKNQKQAFFNQYFQRNGFISRGILAYSKEFQEYIRKRTKMTLNRNNRFRERVERVASTKKETESKERPTPKSTNSAYYLQERLQKASKTQQLPVLREATLKNQNSERKDHNREREMEQLLDIELRNIEIERRKTNYQLKNVYMILNQIPPSTQPIQLTEPRNNLSKINKDRVKLHASLKRGKLSLRTTKFVESQKYVNKPFLEAKPISAAIMMNHSMLELFDNLRAGLQQNRSLNIANETQKKGAGKQSLQKGQTGLVQRECLEIEQQQRARVKWREGERLSFWEKGPSSKQS